MSTFMAFACVDLRPGVAAGPLLTALDAEVRDNPDASRPLLVWTGDRDGRTRVSLLADYGNIWLDDALQRAAATTGDVARAVVGLDHDEYGIEHLVLAGADGSGLVRVQHVHVHPDGEADDDGPPTVDGPGARAAVAALFGVPAERMEQAAREAMHSHEALGAVFTPFRPWWDALGVDYPFNLGDPAFTLDGSGFPPS